MSKRSEKKETIKQETNTGIPHTIGNFNQEPFFKKNGVASIIILVLSFVIYYQSIQFGYVLDDKIVITDNKFTKEGFKGIGDILTTESFVGYFGENKNLVQGNRYRPLSIISFAIEQGILGEQNPMVSHTINILLYALTCILFFLCCSLLFRNYKASWYASIPFIATLIYTTHPTHVEAVANIKGRDEIMTMMFSLFALYSSLRYSDSTKKSWLFYTIISYFLALMSKENAITFLAIIPLSIYFYGNERIRSIKILVFTLLATSILFIIIRSSVVGQFIGSQAQDVMNNPFWGMSTLERMGSTMYSMIKYIGLLIFPHPLSHDYYPYQIPKVSIFTLIPMLSVLLYAALGYFAWRGWKSKSTYAYGILFYLCALSIMSNIFVNVGTFMNERFLFIPSAGFALMLAYFLTQYLGTKFAAMGKWLGLGFTLLLIAGYSWKVVNRVPDWENTMTLNRSAVIASPNSARANAFMATAYFEDYMARIGKNPSQVGRLQHLLDSTEIYSNKSIEILPDYANGNQMLLGVATERYKFGYDMNLYLKNMKPSILRRPDLPFIKEFVSYVSTTGNDAILFQFFKEIGLELLKYKDNRKLWSIEYLNHAVKIKSDDKEVAIGLSQGFNAVGKFDDAKRWLETANRIIE